MELLFAYAAGLLTLINPCVLPVLPIVLATSLQAGRAGPLALAAGMGATFVVVGLGVAALGPALGVTEEAVTSAGALLMLAFGLVLLVPAVGARFATATAGFSAGADTHLDRVDRSGLGGQALSGVLLGLVWSPCIGPTLGGAIALASAGEALGRAALVMVSFALGVGTIVLALAYGTRGALQRRKELLRALALRARPIAGVMFAGLGGAILLGWHHIAEAWLLDTLPHWLTDLSVSI